MNSFEIDGPYKNTAVESNDVFWYGYGGTAYASLAAAKSLIPAVKRKGLTIGVYVSGAIVEYWWPTADIADSDLIIKAPQTGLALVNATDSDYTLIKPAVLKLPALSADAILTMPNPINCVGVIFPIFNQNSTVNKWTFGGNVENLSGATITDIVALACYLLVSDGTRFLVIQNGTAGGGTYAAAGYYIDGYTV